LRQLKAKQRQTKCIRTEENMTMLDELVLKCIRTEENMTMLDELVLKQKISYKFSDIAERSQAHHFEEGNSCCRNVNNNNTIKFVS